MKIKEVMKNMYDASSEEEKELIVQAVKNDFDSMSEYEKDLIRKDFLKAWDETIEEAKGTLTKIDIAIAIEEMSKFERRKFSTALNDMSQMARDTSLKINYEHQWAE